MFHRLSRLTTVKSEYHEAAASLAWLPQDILAEICTNLGPADLYALSIINKSLHLFLTSRSNAGLIWRRAIDEAVADGSLPPPPPSSVGLGYGEIEWVRLVCGGFCSACLGDMRGPVPGTDVLWQLNAGYCLECLPSQVQKRLPKALERAIVRSYWWRLFPHASHPSTSAPLFLSAQIREFTAEFFALPTREDRDECLARLHARTNAINTHSAVCAAWQATLPTVEPEGLLEREGAEDVYVRDTASVYEGFVRRISGMGWYRTAALPNGVGA